MANLILTEQLLVETRIIDRQIDALQDKKTELMLQFLFPHFSDDEIRMFVSWHCITIGVFDRAMCIQLNRLCKGSGKLRFVIDKDVDWIEIKV